MVDSTSVPVTLSQVSTVTDSYGIAYATPTAGTRAGSYLIDGCLGTCSSSNIFEYTFSGNVRNAPVISASAITNSGLAAANGPLAPGSYVTILWLGFKRHYRSNHHGAPSKPRSTM